MAKAKTEYYVNNKEFLEAIVEYKRKVELAKKKGKAKPLVPNYIGECFLKIATHLSYKPNFVNYMFREDMICDGIENCLQYIDNFNPEKSQNPFAYFTQIIYYAFLRRIQKEKKQMYTKYKLMGEMEVMNLTSDSQGHDASYVPQGKMSEWSKDHVGTFIENFEESKRRKKNKNTTAVDVLIGDE